MSVATQVDVVVIGAGACGMVAALAAADGGASVVILEKLDQPGGNTTLSTGSVPAAGTRFQKAAGIADSPDRMITDLLNASGPHEAQDLLAVVADQSAEVVHWLVDRHNVDLQLITDYKHVGHSVPRLHAPADRDGKFLVADLVAACGRNHIEILTSSPATGLIYDGGKVAGVHVEPATGVAYDLAAQSVILAANGYGNNRDLLKRWAPEIAHAQYFGADGSTGEAVVWAEALGAALANTGAYQGYAAVADPTAGSILSWTTVEMGAIILTPTGQRVGNESLGYSGFAAVLSRHADKGYALFDTKIRDYVAAHEPRFVKLMHDGLISEVATLVDAASVVGCDPDILTATVAKSDQAASGESADSFGRTNFGFGPLQAPYCVAEITPGLFHTQGGVRVDGQARVIRSDGSPIPGLYAGGGVAAGISGRSGADGYASGNGLLTAVGLGYIAGRSSSSRQS